MSDTGRQYTGTGTAACVDNDGELLTPLLLLLLVVVVVVVVALAGDDMRNFDGKDQP